VKNEIECREAAASREKFIFVDVRNPDEHAYAAIPNSLLIPLYEIEERAEELEAHKGKPLVVYCHLGVRSLDGAAYLRSLGHDARSLAGGIEAWSCEIDPSIRRY
jgi:rhodanese-related sulfurtransferase